MHQNEDAVVLVPIVKRDGTPAMVTLDKSTYDEYLKKCGSHELLQDFLSYCVSK